MIFDVHCHLGKDVVFDCENTEQELLDGMNQYGIDGGIIQPFIDRPYIKETREIHDRIFHICKSSKKKLFGMASINPHFHYEEYEKEARRCIEELHFVGFKMTPVGHAVDPTSRDGFHVCEVAQAFHVPVMIHTGMGIPFADPIHIAPLIENFPKLTFVIAHAGANFYTTQAIYLAKKYDNVYIETCGSGIGEALSVIHEVGSEKTMFASDAVIQIPMELTKYQTILNEQQKDNVFYKTAQSVYNIVLC